MGGDGMLNNWPSPRLVKAWEECAKSAPPPVVCPDHGGYLVRSDFPPNVLICTVEGCQNRVVCHLDDRLENYLKKHKEKPMKIIEGLKKLKELRKKQDDLIRKISHNSALMSYQTPPYGDQQREKVAGFVQAVHDIGHEILALNVSIQQTNLVTLVAIEVKPGTVVERSVAEWILRRRTLAALDAGAVKALNTGQLREGHLPTRSADQKPEEAKIVRFYDQETRDQALEMFESEPGRIDARLEVVNAVTDLV